MDFSRFTPVALFDPRSAAERLEFGRLHIEVAAICAAPGSTSASRRSTTICSLALAPRRSAEHPAPDHGDARPEHAHARLHRSARHRRPVPSASSASPNPREFLSRAAVVVLGRARGAGRVRVDLAPQLRPGRRRVLLPRGANLLADGKGFISPFFTPVGVHRAAADTRRCTSCSSLSRRCRDEERADAPALVVPARIGHRLAGRSAGRAVGGAPGRHHRRRDRGAVPEPLGARRHARRPRPSRCSR